MLNWLSTGIGSVRPCKTLRRISEELASILRTRSSNKVLGYYTVSVLEYGNSVITIPKGSQNTEGLLTM